MKAFKYLVAYLALVGLIMATCFILMITGAVSASYHGFAVDSKGVLYIGKDTQIEKYVDHKLISAIRSPLTSRGYMFTIVDGDTIKLTTSSNVYSMDLTGEVLAEEDELESSLYNQQYWHGRRFTTANGKAYVQSAPLGRYQIKDETGTVVYRMPALDYAVVLGLIISMISLFACVPVIVTMPNRRKTSA